MGGASVRQLLAASVAHEVPPVVGINPFRARPSSASRARLACVYERGGINFWGLGAFIKGGETVTFVTFRHVLSRDVT